MTSSQESTASSRATRRGGRSVLPDRTAGSRSSIALVALVALASVGDGDLGVRQHDVTTLSSRRASIWGCRGERVEGQRRAGPHMERRWSRSGSGCGMRGGIAVQVRATGCAGRSRHPQGTRRTRSGLPSSFHRRRRFGGHGVRAKKHGGIGAATVRYGAPSPQELNGSAWCWPSCRHRGVVFARRIT